MTKKKQEKILADLWEDYLDRDYLKGHTEETQFRNWLMARLAAIEYAIQELERFRKEER
jgi:hypothetical protein